MKRKKKLKKTLIFVGEGVAERTFLLHLRSFFSDGSLAITVKSAGGKGPEHIIDEAIRTWQCGGFDYCAALLDMDIPWPDKTVKKAAQKGVFLVGSSPCIEGYILKLLGHPVPAESKMCKVKLDEAGFGSTTEKKSFERHITQEVISTHLKDDCMDEVIYKVNLVMTGDAFK